MKKQDFRRIFTERSKISRKRAGIYWIVEQRRLFVSKQVKLAPKCDCEPLALLCWTAAENVIAKTVAERVMMVKRRARMNMPISPEVDRPPILTAVLPWFV